MTPRRGEPCQCFFPARFVASRQPWAANGKAVWNSIASVHEPTACDRGEERRGMGRPASSGTRPSGCQVAGNLTLLYTARQQVRRKPERWSSSIPLVTAASPGLGFRDPEPYNKSCLRAQAFCVSVIESHAGPSRGTAGAARHHTAWQDTVAPGASPTWIG